MKSKVCLALNICTYHRETFIRKNLALLRQSSFFDEQNAKYYGKLHIFIVDNASELQLQEEFIMKTVEDRVASSEESRRFESPILLFRMLFSWMMMCHLILIRFICCLIFF